MKLLPLTAAERAQSGFTHKVSVKLADIPAGTGATDLQIFPKAGSTFPAGTMIGRIAVALITTLAGGSLSTCTLTVKDVTLGTTYIAAYSVYTGATPLAYKATNTTLAYLAADALKLVFTPGANNLNGLTAGEIEVYFELRSLPDMVIPKG